MLIPNRDDENDLLVGYRRWSEFARAEGCPYSTSTLQKRGSPAIGTGPHVVGYFGQLPTTTKGLMRAWLRAQLRPSNPVTKRLKRSADGGEIRA